MSTTTKKAFRVTNTVSGADLGIHVAEDKRDALNVLARAASYEDAIANHVATHEPGDLCDYETAEVIRTASATEWEQSLRAAQMDGGAGVILVDGRRCYAEGPDLGESLSVRPINITATLHADGMGEGATEADYDGWVAYVCDRIDEESGHEVSVRAERYGVAGDDTVTTDDRGDDSEVREAVREALRSLWDSWCADGWNAWMAERAARDGEVVS